MADEHMRVIIEAQNKTQAAFKDLKKNLEEAEKQTQNAGTVFTKFADISSKALTKLKNTVFSLQSAIGGLAVGMLAKSFINAASTSEQFAVRLKVLLGSVEEGNRLFQQMGEYASKVPFQYENIMKSATQLAGVMRGGVDEINKWMPLIGDLAAASGLSIEQTTSQVIRMYSAGAAAADLFRERGILAMLGFQAGVSYSAEETRKKMMEAWEKADSQFRGATAELAKTWEGLLSMLSDKWFQFRNLIMDAGVYDALKEALDDLNKQFAEWIANNEEIIRQKVPEYVERIKEAIKEIESNLNDLMNIYKSIPSEVKYGVLGYVLLGRPGALVFALEEALSEFDLGLRHIIEIWKKTEKSLDNIIDVFEGKKDWWAGELTGIEGIKARLRAEQEVSKQLLAIKNRLLDERTRIEKQLTAIKEREAKKRREIEEAEIKKITELLLKQGLIIGEDYTKAFWMAMEEAGESWGEWISKTEEYQELLQKGLLIAEDYGRAYYLAIKQAAEATEKVSEAARNLGWTFTSALESAIVQGNKLRNVLQGFYQDILRILARTWITEPLATGLTKFISGLFPAKTGHTGFGPGDQPSYQLVPAAAFAGAQRFHAGREIPAIIRDDESVLTPGQMRTLGSRRNVIINQTNNIDARGAEPGVEARIRTALRQVKEETKSEILSSMERGGPFARASGRI